MDELGDEATRRHQSSKHFTPRLLFMHEDKHAHTHTHTQSLLQLSLYHQLLTPYKEATTLTLSAMQLVTVSQASPGFTMGQLTSMSSLDVRTHGLV